MVTQPPLRTETLPRDGSVGPVVPDINEQSKDHAFLPAFLKKYNTPEFRDKLLAHFQKARDKALSEQPGEAARSD